jgi:cellulose synthase/poly-beta-1,6-N-acetylglucosamine synthase-like glycosyltransferase
MGTDGEIAHQNRENSVTQVLQNRLIEQDLKVSVIICTLDRPEALRQAIDGLLALQYSNLEAIVIDSSTTDATFLLVEKPQSGTERWYPTLFGGHRSIF